jgi:hypothetical protein
MLIELSSIEFSQQVWSVVVLDTNRPQYTLHINYLYVLFCDYSSLHVILPQPLFDHVFELNIRSKFLNNHSIDCLENW